MSRKNEKCAVKGCGKPVRADLWIEENGAWVPFCTPHARFALKPTYADMNKCPDPEAHEKGDILLPCDHLPAADTAKPSRDKP